MFKPFTQLVPRGLVKTFTHGYAQSVVAASQSSFACNVNPLGNHNNHGPIRHGLLGLTGQSLISPPLSNPRSSVSHNPEHLTAYFTAWQAQQKSVHPPRQAQHSREQIESAPINESAPEIFDRPTAGEARDASTGDAHVVQRVSKNSRAYSTGAVDGIQKLEDGLDFDEPRRPQVAEPQSRQPLSSTIDTLTWLDLASSIQATASSANKDAAATVQNDQERILQHVALLEPLCRHWYAQPAIHQQDGQYLQSLVQVLFRDGFILRAVERTSNSNNAPTQTSYQIPGHQLIFLAEVVTKWVQSQLPILSSELDGLQSLLVNILTNVHEIQPILNQTINHAVAALDSRRSPVLNGVLTSDLSSAMSRGASPPESSFQSSQLSLETAQTSPISLSQPYFSPVIGDYRNIEQRLSNQLHQILDDGLASGSLFALQQSLSLLPALRAGSNSSGFLVYKKAIQLAASLKRLDLAKRIYVIAQQAVPFNAQIRATWLAWNSILDAMVAVSLTAGDQTGAKQYHQHLNQILSTPSANTHGLYITSLTKKDHVSDEAAFALDVFNRAVSEGVAPTAFLYNAVVAKLAKARRIEDCRRFLIQMETRGIHPTSITYGTIISAFARVANEGEALKFFERMELAPDYRPLPAPFNQMMQFYVQSPHHQSKTKALQFYESMKRQGVEPTLHSFNLLIQAHASLAPKDVTAAQNVLAEMTALGLQPESQHYASLITELGRAQRDLIAARGIFDNALSIPRFQPDSVLYQALIEAMGHNGDMTGTDALLHDMQARRVPLTGYITNALISGYSHCGDLARAKNAFYQLQPSERKPSTYEAMIKACRQTDPMEARTVLEQLRRHRPSFPFKVVRSAEQLLR